MTVPANTRETYGAIGVREDLSNIIYNISPMDTPFMNGVGRGSCDNTTFEWQTDTLSDTATNRQKEGDDYASTAATEPRRLTNFTQISATQVQSSGTSEAVDFAGRKSTQAYQLAKRAKELKRNMETMLLDDTLKTIASSGSARATASVGTWMGGPIVLETPVLDGTQATVVGLQNLGAGSVGPDGTTAPSAVAGSTTAITLAGINETVSRIWDKGGTPDVIMCDGPTKQTISSSSVGGAVVADPIGNNSGGKAITAVNAVDVLVTDFGTFKIVPNRFSVPTFAYFFDYDLWSIDYLRPFRTETLAKSGDNMKQLLIAEYGLRAKNGHGNGQMRGVK